MRGLFLCEHSLNRRYYKTAQTIPSYKSGQEVELTYISRGYMRVTFSPFLSRLPSSYLELLRPRAWGVSNTLRLRCCLWRYVRFEAGVVSAVLGDGVIQVAEGIYWVSMRLDCEECW